jgi:hypothetical protein
MSAPASSSSTFDVKKAMLFARQRQLAQSRNIKPGQWAKRKGKPKPAPKPVKEAEPVSMEEVEEVAAPPPEEEEGIIHCLGDDNEWAVLSYDYPRWLSKEEMQATGRKHSQLLYHSQVYGFTDPDTHKFYATVREWINEGRDLKQGLMRLYGTQKVLRDILLSTPTETHLVADPSDPTSLVLDQVREHFRKGGSHWPGNRKHKPTNGFMRLVL